MGHGNELKMGQKPPRPNHPRPPRPVARPTLAVRPPLPAARRPSRSVGLIVGLTVGLVSALAISLIVVAAVKLSRQPAETDSEIARADAEPVQPGGDSAAGESDSAARPPLPPPGPATGPRERDKPSATLKPKPPPPVPTRPEGGAAAGQPPVPPRSTPDTPPRAPTPNPASPETSSSPPAKTDTAKPTPAKPAEDHRPLDDVRARHRRLSLPDPRTSGDMPKELAKIYIDAASACELQLLGAEAAFGTGRRVTLVRSDTADGARQWAITSPSGMGLGRDSAVGVFEFRDHSLYYLWKNRSAGTVGAALARCLLEVKAGGEHERCTLARPPEKCEPLAVAFEARASRQELKLNPVMLPDSKQLRFEVRPDCQERFEIQPDEPAKPGEPRKVRIFGPAPSGTAAELGAPALELEVRLDLEGTPTLSAKVYIQAKERHPDGRVLDKRVTFSRRWMEDQRKLVQQNKVKVNSEGRKITAQLEGAKRAVESLRNMEGTNSGSRFGSSASMSMSFIQQRAMAEQRLSQATQAEAANRGQEAYLASLDAWLTELQKLVDRIQNGLKLHLVIYQEVEGEKIVYLTTRAEDP